MDKDAEVLILKEMVFSTIDAMLHYFPEDIAIMLILHALGEKTEGRFQYMSGNLKPEDVDEVKRRCAINDLADQEPFNIH